MAAQITQGKIAFSPHARLLLPVDFELMESCFRLRYGYFAQERGWVAPEMHLDGLERDGYDERALHLAVFEDREAVAYLRVLPHNPNEGFMLDREFAALLSEAERQVLPRERAVELSRLVCRCGRWDKGQPHPLELLLKRLYLVSKECGYERYYIVVEEAWLRTFARRFGLPFQVIGAPLTFPDGTRTVAATATLGELETAMLRRRPSQYEWYQALD